MTLATSLPARRAPLLLAALVFFAVLGLALAQAGHQARGGSATGAVQRFEVVADGMRFRLASADEQNPTLVVAPGERVEITLRNLDVGVRHNLAVRGAVNIQSRLIRAEESIAISFIAPQSGSLTYYCTPHSRTMMGTIVVKARAG